MDRRWSNLTCWLPLVAAAIIILLGLLTAPPVSAQVVPYTIVGEVVPTDPGPFVGRICLMGGMVCVAFADVQEDGSFTLTYPLDFTYVLPPSTLFELRIAAFDPYHYREERSMAVYCEFGPAGWSCEPIPPITIGVASAYGNLEGTVRNASGQPVEGAVVEAVSTRNFPGTATTNAAGYFRYPVFDPAVPMFGRKYPFLESDPDELEYEVRVVSMPAGEAPPPPQKVTVSRGVLARVTFGPSAPNENRPFHVAQGPPTAPELCPTLVGRPVNVTTGNMYTQQEDLGYPSAFGRFALTRTYNSQATYAGPLGLGWSHPYEYELKELRPGVIRVRTGAGNIRFYDLADATTQTYRVGAPTREAAVLVKHAAGYTETEPDGLVREYNLAGQLFSITNRAGWQTILTYTNGPLNTVTDPGGRTLAFRYAAGKLNRVEGPGGLFVDYGYDAQGRVVSVADGMGVRWTYGYTETGPSRLASIRDANGHLVEEHTYDGEGRVIFTQQAEGVNALTLEYLGPTVTRVTDALGRVTTYTHGVFGDQPLITRIEGPCPCGTPDSVFGYDAQGRRTALTDARGHTTRFTYDAQGNLLARTDPFGQVTTWSYNDFGQVLSTTDPTGATTTFTYDDTTGVLVESVNALGQVTRTAPTPANLPGAVTDPRGATTTFAYDPAGLLTATTDPPRATTTFAYDAAGRLLTTTDALGGTTRLAYDLRGRRIASTDPLGAQTHIQYDAAGNRTAVLDPRGRQTTSTYDANNRLLAVTDPAGGVTRYAYDLVGNLLTLTDAKGQTTTFAYDGHNRLTRRTDPLGASESFTYDPVGNLRSKTDRRGQTSTFSYDALNRLTERALPDGTTVTSTFDPLGRLLTVTDPRGTLSYTYDLLGRVRSTTSQDGRTLAYTYDAAGNRTSLQDETGQTLTSTYDSRNLLTTLADPRTGSFGFTYDQLGRRIALTRPNGTETRYRYDPASRLLALTHAGPGGALETLTYTYDTVGNRTADTRNQGAQQYGYDLLDQLLQVEAQRTPTRWRTEEAYTYDPVGNRLTDRQQHAYQYDAANRLATDGVFTYAYDANGNLTETVRLADGVQSRYTYDAEDRLIGVVTPSVEVTFRYDPLGRRIEKQVIRWQDADGDSVPDPEEELPPRITRYLYDGEDILATFTDAGRERARYTHGPGIDEPLAELRRAQATFYHADVLGSIIALTDPRSQPLRQYQYQAFGRPEDYRRDRQPYRFTGREWDREIGLYYYRARYYDPRVGRFLQEDPIGLAGGINLCVYVRSSPTRFTDPYGLKICCEEDIKKARKECFKEKVNASFQCAACVAICAAAETGVGAFACSLCLHNCAWRIIVADDSCRQCENQ